MELNANVHQLLLSLQSPLTDFKKMLDADLSKYEELEQNRIKNAQVQNLSSAPNCSGKALKPILKRKEKRF